MSHLLTLGVLQQARNFDDGDVLYSGTMTIGYTFWANPRYGYEDINDMDNIGSINPLDSKLQKFFTSYGEHMGNKSYFLDCYYDDTKYELAACIIDNTIYTNLEVLHTYLKNAYDNNETVEIKIYEK